METPWNKEVIKEGSGCHPSDGYFCNLEVEVPPEWSALGPPFNEGKFTYGIAVSKRASSPLLTLLDDLVKSMTTGEISTFTFSEETLRSVDIAVAQSSNVAIKIRLMSMDKPVYEMSSAERLDYAKEEKATGTQIFKDGDVELAFTKFSNAAKVLISISQETDFDLQAASDLKHLRCLVHLNLALCQLRSENYLAVIKNCDVVVKLDPSCQKAWFRRGQANVELRNFEAAKKDFDRVCQLDPQNKAAQKESEKVSEYLKKSDQKLGKALSKMFV